MVSYTMSKDIKTLEALEKIKAILTEYDLWALLTVCSTERAHWVYHVDASWSCLAFDPETGHARMKAIGKDFSTSQGHKYVLDQTIGAIFSSRDFAAMMFDHMDKLAKMLEKRFDIDHEPWHDLEYHNPKKPS